MTMTIDDGMMSAIHSRQKQGALHSLITILFLAVIFSFACSSSLSAAITIDRISGRLSTEERDISLRAGAVTIEISRSLSPKTEGIGLFGSRWISNWEKRLTESEKVILLNEPSETISFEKKGSNEYRSRTGEKIVIGKDGTRLRYKTDGTSEHYSSDGRLLEIRYLSGNIVKLSYNAQSRLTRISGPYNQAIEIEPDSQGKVLRVGTSTGMVALYTYDKDFLKHISVNGQTASRFSYDAAGRLASIEELTSGTSRFSYDDKGRVASRKFPNGSEEKYRYDDNNRKYQHIDPSGSVTTTVLHEDRRTQEIINPLGNKTILLYNPDGQVMKITDPSGSTIALTYDDLGRIIAVKDALGNISRNEYAGDTVLIKKSVRPDGTLILYDYDNQQRIKSVTIGERTVFSRTYTPDGLVESMKGIGIPERAFTYYPDGRLKSSANALNEKTTYEYDKSGNLIRETTPSGGVIIRDFDGMNRQTKETDQAGLSTQYSYDEKGRLSKITLPNGRSSSYTHDAMGRIVSMTLSSGETISHLYDAAGRLSEKTGPGSNKELYRYDPAGRLIEKKDQWSNAAKYEYNERGKVIKEEQPGGLVIRYRYDKAGSLIVREDNTGSRTTYEYDDLGQIIEMTDGIAITEYTYDPLGRLLSVVNPLGKNKEFIYGFNETLDAVVEPNGDMARYEYDLAGRLIAGQSPAGGSMRLAYDKAGNLISEKDPLSNELRYTYDSAGRLIKKINASGQSVTISYDQYGQLAEEKFPDGRTIRYTYDSRGNRIEASDGKFPIRYTYDRDNRLSVVDYSALKKTIKYEYNDKALRSRLILPDNKDIRYEYDRMSRLLAIVLPDGKKVRFTYDLKDRRDKIMYPNGVTGNFEYDAEEHTVAITYRTEGGRTLFSERYTHDANGNLIQREDADRRITGYLYDPSGQLIEEAGPDRTVQYSYGPGGNRIEIRQGADSITYKYDKADRMIAAGSEALSYDADGNLISRKGAGQKSYAYDAENRLIRASDSASGKVSYGYDHTGARVSRRDSEGTTYFLYDGLDLIQEVGDKLDNQATYVYAPGIDRPVVMLRDGKSYYYHADRLGSIRQLTDDQASVAANYDYDAFGKITRQEAKIRNPFTYTAREFDTATGLYYYRARFYDPDLGRFLSQDPILPRKTEPLTLNPYLYVKNSPVRFTDPLGLMETNTGWEGPLWLVENYINSFKDKLARLDAGQNVGSSSRQALLNEITKLTAEAEAYRAHYPGIQPQKPSWYVDPTPTPQAAGASTSSGVQSSGSSTTGASGNDTLAVRPGGVKGDTLAVRPPGGAGNDTLAVRPGGAKGDTVAVRPTGGGAAGGISGTTIASGVGGVLGAIGAYVNLQACLDEGNSKAWCYGQTALAGAVGVGVGVLLAPVVAAGGTAATVIAVGGAGLAAAGAGAAGVRWVNAPEVKAQMEQEAGQQAQIRSLNAQLAALRGLGGAFCAAQNAAYNDALKTKAAADALVKSRDAALGDLSSDVQEGISRACGEAVAKMTDLPQKIAKAEEWIDKAKQGFEESINRLSECSSQKSIDDADELLRAATALGLSAERKYREAQADIETIKEAKRRRDEAANKIKNKLLNQGVDYYLKKEEVKGLWEQTKDSNDAAKDNLAEFNTKRNELLAAISSLKGLISPKLASELSTISAGINNAVPPCPTDRLSDYRSTGREAWNSVNIKMPKDLNSLTGLATSMGSAGLQLGGIITALSACDNLKVPTGSELDNVAGNLGMLQVKTYDWLKKIADLRGLCYAKLTQKKPPVPGQKPPDKPEEPTTQKPPSQPSTPPPDQPPPKPHVLSRFGVSCYPQEIPEDGSSNCRATGEYADNPNVYVDLTGSASWPNGNGVSGSGRGGTSVTVTANLEGASDSATVRITKKVDEKCPPGGPWKPECDPNTQGGTGGSKPPVNTDVNAPGGPGQGNRPSQGTAIGGSQPTQQPGGYTTPSQPPGGPTGDTSQPPYPGPMTGPMGPCPPGSYLGPDNQCRKDTPCPPTFARSPVTGRCESTSSPYDPSRPGGPSKPGSGGGPVKPGKDGKCPSGCHLKPDGSGECHCPDSGSGTTPPSSSTPPPSKPPTTSRPTGGGGG